jgi:hypothetical protein
MALAHPLNDELNAWSERLGAQAFAEAREEYRRQHGRNGTPHEVVAFLIAARGSERIQAIWHRLQTATAVELGIGG